MASIRRIFWEKGREKKAIFEAGSQATAGLAAPFHSLLTVVELRLEAAGCALAAISHLASQLSFPFFKRSRRSRAKSSRFGSTAKCGRTPCPQANRSEQGRSVWSHASSRDCRPQAKRGQEEQARSPLWTAPAIPASPAFRPRRRR